MEKVCESSLSGSKVCKSCGERKPREGFSKCRTTRDKLQSSCKTCTTKRATEWKRNNRDRVNAWEREWRARNPEKAKDGWRDRHYRRRFGIGLSEIRKKLDVQRSRCSICTKHIDENSMVVDHNHSTGAVRDCLCNSCNIALGFVETKGLRQSRRKGEAWIKAALEYLERHGSEE